MAKEPSTVTEILTGARSFLTDATWAKDDSAWPVKSTLHVAINNCARGRGVDNNRHKAETLVLDAIHAMRGNFIVGIQAFNDDPITTLADIHAVLDEAKLRL